ncbi:MAG: hypothetical protein AAGB22_09925 [Bacteroidota bacterium]
MKKLALCLLLLPAAAMLRAQTEIDRDGLRPWYSVYLHKKINHRWSVDNFNLLATRSTSHDFWLTQINVGVNYRIDRFYTLSFGYGQSFYQWSPWWRRRYDREAGALNLVNFHTFSLSLRRTDRIGQHLALTNRVIVQQYLPRFEKYQTRFQYNVKLKYRKRNLPGQLRPFVQGAIYYYLNGVPLEYWEEEGEDVALASPNGLHRYRVRVGATFRPVPSLKRLSFMVFYGVNKEFNLSGFGRPINYAPEEGDRPQYPFNNFTFAGIQLNYFFK